MRKAIGIDIGGDKVGLLFQRSTGVAHSNPEVAGFNHLDVVLAVAYAYGGRCVLSQL